jgi:flagellar biosynthesis/type III secretory pathway chaperone
MTGLDPRACRAQFSRLLTEEARLLGELEVQLQREHQFLSANDVESLEQAGSARQNTVVQLLRIDDERRDLCRLLGQGTDRTGLAALLAWCDPAGTLADAQSSCAGLAERCRAQNERNGALVTARLNRVAGMLDMIGTNSAARTYGPRLAHCSPEPVSRMVSVSA